MGDLFVHFGLQLGFTGGPAFLITPLVTLAARFLVDPGQIVSGGKGDARDGLDRFLRLGWLAGVGGAGSLAGRAGATAGLSKEPICQR